MASRNHIIRRQVIELEVPSVEKAWEIQERVSELYKYQLLQVLEEIFDAIVPDGEVLRIDRLEVDLGNVNAGNLEEEVVAKVRERVEQRLMELRQKADFQMEETPGESTAARRQSSRQSKTDFLLHFLLTGTAPWWRNRGEFGTIVSILEELIAERPAWIRKQLVPLLKEATVRKRIVAHLDDQQLAKLVSLVKDSTASHTKRLLQLLHEERLLAGKFSEHPENTITAGKKRRSNSPAFRFERIRNEIVRTQLWEAILARIAGEEASLRSLLREISFVAGKEEFAAVKSIVQEFAAAAGATPLLRETTTAAFRKLKQASIVLKRKKKKRSPHSELENSLENDTQDSIVTEQEALAAEESLLTADESILTAEGSALAAEEENTGAEEESTDATVETNSPFRRRKRVEKKSIAEKKEEESDDTPEDSSAAVNDKKRSVKSSRKKKRKTLRPGEEDFPAETGESSSDELLTQHDEADAAESSRKKKSQLSEEEISSRKKQEQNKPAEQDENDAEEDEELYEPAPEDLSDFVVDNAGLVLVWPYLGHFFGALGLVKDRKFVDEAAAHRAVHLLQYMAEGGAFEYEEHDLVLNKILCGLEVTEPIDMHFTITDEEKDEVQGLLEAVIQNWKGIGRTSVNGLQVTFLQKEGSLKRQGEGWHLGIERKTVDVLLDRLPWTISIIRLPWVDETIFVEW